jgi:hypothetical protein
MAPVFSPPSRRAEGLSTRSSTRNNMANPQGNHHAFDHNRQQQPNIGRKKRHRDSIDDAEAKLKVKRAKVTVEIDARPQSKPRTRSFPLPNARLDVALTRQRRPSPKRDDTTTQTAPPPLPTQKPAVHHQKVVNGIRHELDRLQPNATDLTKKDEKRKLRSQEGTRFKSELSAYFPEYDEMIGNEPKEERKFHTKIDYN